MQFSPCSDIVQVHCGTTPMKMRADTLLCFAKMTVKINEIALETPGALATVAVVNSTPQSVNTIAGLVQFSIDARAKDDATLAVLDEKIRVAGEGQPGIGGGPRGDLYLVISVRADTQFERRGDDLYVDIDADLVTVMLGGEVPVPLPDGRKLVLTIPAETQNGRLFRLSGKGMPRLRGDGNGTLFARIKVVLPMQLTEAERDLFEQLAQGRSQSAEVGS